MTPESVRELYDYTYRTFDKVWDCIMHLSDEQFVQELDYSIGSIRNHVVHLMSVEQRWLKRLQEAEVPADIPFSDYTTRAAVKAKYDGIRAEILEYVNGLTQQDLDGMFTYSIPYRDIFNRRNHRWEFLLHIANHSTDHRSQILAMLKLNFNAPTVEQDFSFYLFDKG